MKRKQRPWEVSPDFDQLSLKYPSFKDYVHHTKSGFPTIDWTDPYAQRELTKVLLKEYFNISWNIPINHLCPPVPQRANYLDWISELLCALETKPADCSICGIDIGTGASCIFPLIGYGMFKWNFLASDIDKDSINSAIENVRNNKLESKIKVVHVKGKNILRDIIEKGQQPRYEFCVCNPPFFSSTEEIGENPNTICKATSNEQITEGGEEQFISRMIKESVELKNKIIWFTSMVGKKSSLKQLKSQIQQLPVKTFVSTEFSQGKTSRWGIAWTFYPVDIDSLPGKVHSLIKTSSNSSDTRNSKISRKMKILISNSKPNTIIETAKNTLELYSDLFKLKTFDKSLGNLSGELKITEEQDSKNENLSLQVLQLSPQEHILEIECSSISSDKTSKDPPPTFSFIYKILSKSLS